MDTGTRSALIPPSVGDLAALGASWRRSLVAGNKSPMTIKAYMAAVDGLAAHLAAHGMPTAVDRIAREHVESYLADQLATRAAATAHQRYRGLLQFFKWCLEEGEIRENPMRNMRPPIVPEGVARVLTEDEIRRLLATCDASPAGRRDEALIRLLLDSGARLGEATRLTLEDVDLDGAVVRLFGKGRRWRLVAISPKTCKALDRWLRRRGMEPGPLWVGARGPMTESGVRQMIWRRSAQAGIPRVHPHALRHSMASQWLQAGGSEGGLMKRAGWRSRAMLQRYASSTAEQRAIEEAHRLGLGDRY
jgi:site-specific recombinase XerD